MVSLQPSLSSLQALPAVLPCSLWNSWLEEGCMNIWRLSCLLWILLCSREAVFLLLIRIHCGIFRTCHFMSSFCFRKNCLFTFTACFDASRLHLLACCGGFLLIFKRFLHFFNIIFSLLPRFYVLIVTQLIYPFFLFRHFCPKIFYVIKILISVAYLYHFHAFIPNFLCLLRILSNPWSLVH